MDGAGGEFDRRVERVIGGRAFYDAGGVSYGSRWSERSERPPESDDAPIFHDPGRGRVSNTRRREFSPRPLPRSEISRRVRDSGGLALRARPPATGVSPSGDDYRHRLKAAWKSLIVAKIVNSELTNAHERNRTNSMKTRNRSRFCSYPWKSASRVVPRRIQRSRSACRG